MNEDMIAVVVTTEFRGIFFGYAPKDADLEAKTIKIYELRMVVYYPKEQHSIIGLCSKGPIEGSRVSPAAPWMVIQGVTGILGCTNIAVARWESEPWA